MSAERPPAATARLQAALNALGNGNLDEAQRQIDAFRATDADHPEGFHIAGLIAYQRGDHAGAAELMAGAIAAGSKNPAHHANLGLVLKTCGRFAEAVAAYDTVVDLVPENGNAWNDRGTALAAAGRAQEAAASYRRALEINPLDHRAAVNFGHALLASGQADDALQQFDRALQAQPAFAPALDGRGLALKQLDRLSEAEAAFAKAADIALDDAKALTNLAALFEETNRPEKAKATAEQALARRPGDPHAELILAKCRRRADEIDSAIAGLAAVPREGLPAALRRDIAFELARLFDRAEDPAAAFAAMEEGNRQSLAAEGEDERLGETFLQVVRDLTDWATPAHAHHVATIADSDESGEPEDPIFLVGFPRSGTTLLGQIMDAHSALCMIEERPLLTPVIECLRRDFGGYPSGLEHLGARDLANLRARYFNAAETESGGLDGRRLVDKFPLHMIHAGLIASIFPNARYVFALRHPCDVVLSCFMQNFRVNAAMANFFSIERAAQTYDAVMSLWRRNVVAFDPARHTVRYEDVVEDFGAQAATLLDFLGLQWEDGIRDYAERARERGRIDTPSYHQVTEQIYTRARGRWRRYADQMAPAMASLDPWIETYGYGDEP